MSRAAKQLLGHLVDLKTVDIPLVIAKELGTNSGRVVNRYIIYVDITGVPMAEIWPVTTKNLWSFIRVRNSWIQSQSCNREH